MRGKEQTSTRRQDLRWVGTRARTHSCWRDSSLSLSHTSRKDEPLTLSVLYCNATLVALPLTSNLPLGCTCSVVSTVTYYCTAAAAPAAASAVRSWASHAQYQIYHPHDGREQAPSPLPLLLFRPPATIHSPPKYVPPKILRAHDTYIPCPSFNALLRDVPA